MQQDDHRHDGVTRESEALQLTTTSHAGMPSLPRAKSELVLVSHCHYLVADNTMRN
jgi:hypothetical protein